MNTAKPRGAFDRKRKGEIREIRSGSLHANKNGSWSAGNPRHSSPPADSVRSKFSGS